MRTQCRKQSKKYNEEIKGSMKAPIKNLDYNRILQRDSMMKKIDNNKRTNRLIEIVAMMKVQRGRRPRWLSQPAT